MQAFQRCLEILDRLRVECPWDRKQTYDSLRPNTIEEVYELSDAILKKNPEEIKIETGDVLLHLLFYAKFAEEQNLYTIADICNSLCDKLIYRHPHIFGSAEAKNSDDVTRNWEILKLREGKNKTVLGGVPDSLPSVIKAHRIQDKAANSGFDWEKKEEVWNKVEEETREVKEAIASADPKRIEEEFGDLLFSVINAARLYKVNSDTALERTNQKFIKRFNYIESKAKEQGRLVNDLSLAEMDALWNEAKRELKP